MQPAGKTHIEEGVEDHLAWDGPHTGAGEECGEEGAAETM